MSFKTTRSSVLAVLIAALLLAACGPITEEDLQKWSHNEEGFKMMNQVVNDPEVPFETKVRALTVLVENGAAEKIRGIVRDSQQQKELVDALSAKLLEHLKGTNEEFTANSRDALLSLIAMLDEAKRDMVQKELAAWAFGDVTHQMTKEQVWTKVQNRMSFPQVRELEKYGVEPALIMIEKGLETKEFSTFDWVDFLLAFQDKALTDRTLESLKISHKNLFEEMKTSKDVYFRQQDLIIIEKFYNMPAVLYLLDLAENDNLDRGTQMEALIRAHELFDKVIPEDEKKLHVDKLIPVMLRRMPLLNGQKRVEWATEILQRSGYAGLDKVSLFEEAPGGGQDQKTLKVWMSRKYFSIGAFLSGVMADYLDGQKEAQVAILKKSWEKDGRWPPAAPAPAPAPAEPAAPTPEGQPAAEAAAPAPAAAPDIRLVPEFKIELTAAVDATITQELKSKLSSPALITRLFAVAGLKHLATTGAEAALRELAANGKGTDLSLYFPKATMATIADTALTAVEMGREFDNLKVEMQEKQQLPAEHLDIIRRQMMADMGLSPTELRATYLEKIEKQKEKVETYKQQFKDQLEKYHKYIKIICAKQVTEYPDPANAQAMEKYISDTAIVCEKEAKEALNEKKLTLFKFAEEHYRAAVILAIKKKEEVRRRALRARVRAYLRVASEAFTETNAGKTALGKVKNWKLDDVASRKIIDKIVIEALRMAREAADKAPADKKGRIGLTQAEIDEYGTMEVPEGYVLASLVALNWKLEWTEKDPKNPDDTRSWSYVQEDASKRFSVDGYWASPENFSFINNNIDASYAAFTLATDGLEAAAKSWGFPEQDMPGWQRIIGEFTASRDAGLQEARARTGAPDNAMEAYVKYAPALEMIAESYVLSYDAARKLAAEKEAAAAAAAAPAPAPAAGTEGTENK